MREAKIGVIPWIKGRKHSEGTKRKMKEAHIGRKLSEEHRRRIGEAHKGKQHRLGQKQSLAEIEKKREANRYRMKSVRCIETGEVFESQRQAARSMGLKFSALCRVLDGKRKSTKGFTFVRV
jgi:hypothetical protein